MRRLIIKIAVLNFLISIFISVKIYAVEEEKFVPRNPIEGMSPNAASIKRYGDIPMSLYTGSPSVSIPLVTLQEGQISLPVGLSYHTSIKVDEHPGWVGLGWSLTAGGVISREVRDMPDETLVLGYKYKCTEQNIDNASFNDISNLVYLELNYQVVDSEPDKFNFSFPGYSGYFMLNSKGEWMVYSDRPLKINVIENISSTPRINFPNGTTFTTGSNTLIKGFILTDDEGTEYRFGYPSSSAEPAIELAINSKSQMTSKFQPNAWHLVEIKRINGDKIDIEYMRGDFIVNFSNSIYRIYDASRTYLTLGSPYSGQLISPVYISKISGTCFTADFTSSISNELKYSGSDYIFRSDDGSSNGFGTMYSSDMFNDTKWRKLDGIEVRNSKGVVTDNFEFNYIENPYQRLTLDNLSISCLDDTPVEKYSFSYHNIDKLPAYLSEQNDLWGFYGCYTNDMDSPNYKRSDKSKTGYGLLTKITYPTGGNTIFEYEPHTYTYYIDVAGSLVPAESMLVAGGARIKRIINVPFDGGMPEYKDYSYPNGILEGQPDFRNEFFCNTSQEVLYTFIEESNYSLSSITNNFGNHISYPRVIEKFADGSYTVHDFVSPMIAGYRDESPISTNHAGRYLRFSHKGQYRGKPMAVNMYNNNGKLIKSVNYNYTSLDEKFNGGLYVEMINVPQVNSKNGVMSIPKVSLYKNYFYSMLQTSTMETITEASANPGCMKQSYHRYNSDGQLICDSTVTTRRGVSMIDITRYSYLWETNSWYAARNIKNLLSDILFQHNGKTKSHIVNEYYLKSDRFPVLGKVVNKFDGSDSKTLYRCALTDDKGLPVHIIDASGLSIIYLWGEDRTHPLAEIKNADVSEIRQVLGYGPADSYKDIYLRDKMSMLRNSLPNAWVTSYNYEPMIGVINITDPSGKTTYYDYDRQKRLFLVRDLYGNYKVRYTYQTFTGASTGTDYINPVLSNTSAQ